MDETNRKDSSNKESNMDSETASKYARELVAEKFEIDPHQFPKASRLLDEEIFNVQTMGRTPMKYVDVYREVPVKVTAKVLVPVKEFPKFNFVGKLLGPKGITMQRLQEETMCKISVLGKGSMKNPEKEQECRSSLDPKYVHLADDLHVKITAWAKPTEAHGRIAFALEEIKKYLVPDKNDEISQEQSQQLKAMSGGEMEPRSSFQRNPMRTDFKRGFSSGRPPLMQNSRMPSEPHHFTQSKPGPKYSNFPKSQDSQYSSYDYNEDFSNGYEDNSGDQWKYQNPIGNSGPRQNRRPGYRPTPY